MISKDQYFKVIAKILTDAVGFKISLDEYLWRVITELNVDVDNVFFGFFMALRSANDTEFIIPHIKLWHCGLIRKNEAVLIERNIRRMRLIENIHYTLITEHVPLKRKEASRMRKQFFFNKQGFLILLQHSTRYVGTRYNKIYQLLEHASQYYLKAQTIERSFLLDTFKIE